MDNSEIRSAVQAGLSAGKANFIENGGAYAIVPDGAELSDLERFMPAPAYAKASVSARTVQALIDYTNRHRTPATSIFADVEAGSVEAVIDFVTAENAPAHKANRIRYSAPFSEEWKRWTSISGKPMNQEAFATFIEENREDVVTPDGATMLELAKTLDAKKKVTFKSGIRLENGSVTLDYTDDTTATGGISGKLPIPTEIELGVPVFYGGDRYKITAFFRYRINEGKLVMWIDLHRIKHIRDAAFSDIIAAVAEAVSDVPVYEAAIDG
ncbi:hypothetical protein GCM10007989_07630 [Devosia pacifica]|uniref:DUF2303 family protein n=1 Tax=Devosia pacifica TaxID=1335967 RepID=A0A918RY53_9HYPH|nr:DUF2303 family protein [Devosia pacifica]GHA15336.1 hypothetical protein GCM10007989_07630 [Devosia pacifica]